MPKFTYTGDSPVIFPGLTAPDGSTLTAEPGDVVEIPEEAAVGVAFLSPVDAPKAKAAPAEDTSAE